MMSFRPFAVICVSLTFLTNTSVAKEKQREWKTGTVLDTDRDKTYVGGVDDASGSATTSGNTTYGNASGTSTAVYRVYETYTIAAGDYVYVCQEHIKWRWSKPALLTVNGPVQFAIEKDHIFIKSEDGRARDENHQADSKTSKTVPERADSQELRRCARSL